MLLLAGGSLVGSGTGTQILVMGNSLSGMRYDQMQAPSNKTSAGHGEETATTTTLSMVHVIQKAVNTSRQANAKVKRLEQEIETKGEQWDAFQKALKQVFRDQLAQYEGDQQRLEKDLSEARRAERPA